MKDRIKGQIRLQTIAVLIGLMLIAIKAIAWFFTNSNAILADALEGIVNVMAGSFALYSLVITGRPRDKNHPYGHGKIEYLSAGFEGALIFFAGATMIVKAGYNLIHPQIIQRIDLGIALTAFSGIVLFIVGYLLEKKGKKENSLILIADGKHLKSDALTSFGLLLGLVLLYFTRLPWIDNLLAIGFGLVLIYMGIKLMRRFVGGIMDEADYGLIDKTVNIINANRKENWIDIHSFRIIKFGQDLHIDCHLTLPWYFNTSEGHDEVESLEQMVNEKNDLPVELFIHVDPCKEGSCRICMKKSCAVRKFDFEEKITWKRSTVLSTKQHEK